jgi:multidrug efflux pump subunit AcrA (membrane-fusion protein)
MNQPINDTALSTEQVFEALSKVPPVEILARQSALTMENTQHYQQLYHLTQALQNEYHQLQSAAHQLEENQFVLQDKIKQGKRLRNLLTLLVIVIGLATGWQHWSDEVIAYFEPNRPAAASSSHEAVANKTIKVAQRPIQVTLTLMGKIEPLNQIEVVSPLEGKVKEKHFQYNQFAKQGQVLLVIDTSSEELKRQKAQADYIEAVKKVEKLRNWLQGSEMASAQRELTKSQRSMVLTERTLKETRRLFEQGIIAAQDLEKEEEGYRTQQLDYQTQQEKFKDLLEEGSKEKVQVAELNMEVARASLEEIKNRIQNARLATPMAGVVLLPEGSKKTDDGVQEIQEGSMVKQNQVLFVIANMDGFTINAKVDELDILKLEIGQKATITGEAFRNITLEGKISSISSRADKEDNGPRGESSTSEFAITIAVAKLTADQKKQLRLGMSTEMKIFLYEKKNALVVPFDAVAIKDKNAWVTVQDKKTGQPKEVKVKLGQTLVDGALEILEGLEASDELLPRVIEPDKEEEENL